MKIPFLKPTQDERAVRALESIAASLSDLRDATFRIHGYTGAVREVDDDTPDEDLVSYTDERAVRAYQERVEQRARDGFPLGGDDLAPRQ